MFQKVHKYLHEVTPERSQVLRDMEKHAKEIAFPIVGPLVGRFLFQMATLIKARRILELGSGYGYSAFWFSMAVQSRGHITMTDSDRANKRLALDYFKKAGLSSQIDFRVGDALKVVKKMDGPFDIILSDIDKIDYPLTTDLVAPRLRKGGLFITDNVLWEGRVCDRKKDETTEAIVTFTRQLYQDSRFHTTIMPLRDGLAVAVRL